MAFADSARLRAGFENAPPLPDTFNADGKSLYNGPLTGKLSAAYEAFQSPIDSSNNGFDFHVYYMQSVDEQKEYARALHERVRREFPELRIYRFWEKPIGKDSMAVFLMPYNAFGVLNGTTFTGPHPVAMFEINTFNPHQTGALFSWLAVNRGPCSVLIHPNTDNALKDHTELATWMGQAWPLNLMPLSHQARFGPNGTSLMRQGTASIA